MPETILDDKVISLRSFESLYDQYTDFCRKLRFFIKSALVMEEESLALELISELLEYKEKDLDELRAATQGQIKGCPPNRKRWSFFWGVCSCSTKTMGFCSA